MGEWCPQVKPARDKGLPMIKAIRPIRIKGDIAYITLTKGYEAVIDASDVHLVEENNWCVLVGNGCVYATRLRLISGKRQHFYMHRRIMGEPLGLQIDHIDRNGLNNRRENLRCATASQNQQNACRQINNTSGFKGVSWHNASRKWMARIMMDGHQHHLGIYDTPEAAHAAYREASARMHGEFGRTE